MPYLESNSSLFQHFLLKYHVYHLVTISSAVMMVVLVWPLSAVCAWLMFAAITFILLVCPALLVLMQPLKKLEFVITSFLITFLFRWN